jgi:hypothetical protein
VQPMGDRRQTERAARTADAPRGWRVPIEGSGSGQVYQLALYAVPKCHQIVIELRAHYRCSAVEPLIPEWGTTVAAGTALICVRILRWCAQLSGAGLAPR